MTRSQQFDTAAAGGWSLANRLFGVGFRRETYANLAYLLARFPLGIVYFTVLVTGLSLGVGLVPMVVGLPILVGVLALGGCIGVVEAELLSRLRRRDVSVTLADPRELSVTEYPKTVATTPRNYLLVAFGLASFVVGIPLFVAITVVFSIGFTLAATPFVYWIPGVGYDFTGLRGTIGVGWLSVDAGSVVGASINTLPEALAASAVGVVVCLAGLHAVNLGAWLLAGLTERLLTFQSE
ncbi:sensor domain-containing protein [Haloplanus salinarum]|uniref:sensor domain-containing protein n=1 Tax=Haloplanus salinarum TaxID=1912324 RepID=UPI00214CF83F|nr:sensor domain-containing protein [Haloplanus salinarum]